ncbi:MAG: hypothetical protein AB1762_15625 [Gemmatimonadota bacterium]
MTEAREIAVSTSSRANESVISSNRAKEQCDVARQPNYGFDKRRKEQARKEKQEQKRLRKLDEARERAANRPSSEPEPNAAADATVPTDTGPIDANER